MKTIYLNDNTAPLEPSVATIGFFDGVHRGHQFLISHVRQEAAHSGLQSLVVTFDRHPRQVLRKDYQPELLSTLDSKLLLLSKTGSTPPPYSTSTRRWPACRRATLWR